MVVPKFRAWDKEFKEMVQVDAITQSFWRRKNET